MYVLVHLQIICLVLILSTIIGNMLYAFKRNIYTIKNKPISDVMTSNVTSVNQFNP